MIMDQNKVDMYIMTNQKYFPAEKIMYIKEKLEAMDESKFAMISTVELKDPTTHAVDLNFPRRNRCRPFYARRCGYGYFKASYLRRLRYSYYC